MRTKLSEGMPVFMHDVPLLDREFDSDSQELIDAFLLHMEAENTGFCVVNFPIRKH